MLNDLAKAMKALDGKKRLGVGMTRMVSHLGTICPFGCCSLVLDSH